jgi:hypothetical protein
MVGGTLGRQRRQLCQDSRPWSVRSCGIDFDLVLLGGSARRRSERRRRLDDGVDPSPLVHRSRRCFPAVVIYNVFARMIAGYRAQLGDASAEVLRLVSRGLDRPPVA